MERNVGLHLLPSWYIIRKLNGNAQYPGLNHLVWDVGIPVVPPNVHCSTSLHTTKQYLAFISVIACHTQRTSWCGETPGLIHSFLRGLLNNDRCQVPVSFIYYDGQVQH